MRLAWDILTNGKELADSAVNLEDREMKLFRSKVWSVVDIGLLKWCCIVTGMIAGAYLADFTRRHIWFFAIAAGVLAIKPAISYFGEDKR